MRENKSVAYVVLSCDPYADIWDAYGELFQRFWSDCPYDCYMASHHIPFDKFGFKPLLIGDDISWSHGLAVLLDVLEKKGYKYAIIAFDDLMLCKNVDSSFVSDSIKKFIEEGGDCLRFVKEKTSRCYKHNKLYGRMGLKVPYRVTLGFALWNIDTLRKIVVEGESAWQFEKNATERSFSFNKFFCSTKSPFKFINLVNKRKIDIAEYNKLLKFLPNAHFEREQVFVKEEKFKGYILYFLLKFVPIRFQYMIYNLLTKPIDL